MNLSIISLIVLVIVVAIGFIKKVNLGFLSIGVAFFLGTVGGMSAKDIAAGFSSSMFVTLVGVTFLFGMVRFRNIYVKYLAIKRNYFI